MLNIHFNLVPTLGMSGNKPLLHLYTFMSRTGKSRGDEFQILIRHVLEETEENEVKVVRLAKQWAEI